MDRPERYGKHDPEIQDDTPVEMPLGYMRPTPLTDLIARMVRTAVESETNDEFETEQEANDFEEPEDPALLDISRFTIQDAQEQEPTPEEPAPDPPPTPAVDPPAPEPAPPPAPPAEPPLVAPATE